MQDDAAMLHVHRRLAVRKRPRLGTIANRSPRNITLIDCFHATFCDTSPVGIWASLTPSLGVNNSTLGVDARVRVTVRRTFHSPALLALSL